MVLEPLTQTWYTRLIYKFNNHHHLTGKYSGFFNNRSNKSASDISFCRVLELLKLQKWVKDTGQKIVIIFEGRDAAGNVVAAYSNIRMTAMYMVYLALWKLSMASISL